MSRKVPWVLLCAGGVQGEPPSQRVDCCSLYHPLNQELVIYGGRQVNTPFSLLADLHILSFLDGNHQPQQQQQQQQRSPLVRPVWRQVQPTRLAGGDCGGATSGQQQQQQGMIPLAGHSGGVVSVSGAVVFVGGYRRNDFKEPQPLLQVKIRRAVGGGWGGVPASLYAAALRIVNGRANTTYQGKGVSMACRVSSMLPVWLTVREGVWSGCFERPVAHVPGWLGFIVCAKSDCLRGQAGWVHCNIILTLLRSPCSTPSTMCGALALLRCRC